MTLPSALARIGNFLRTRYPHEVRAAGYVPLLALLRRRLGEEEIAAIAIELTKVGQPPVSRTDISVAITKITNELPNSHDLDRVAARMHGSGLPIGTPGGNRQL